MHLDYQRVAAEQHGPGSGAVGCAGWVRGPT